MKKIKIIIQGQPIAKKRPRFARMGKFVKTYSDQQTEEGKAYMIIAEQMKYHEKFIGVPLRVDTTFYFKRPKSHYGTGKNANILKPSAPKYPITKPDRDNCQKFIYDVCNGLVWDDDSRIVDGTPRKRYDNNNPRTEIEIEVMD
jgi:Holliday junction resolvase RusA-like endonuclease